MSSGLPIGSWRRRFADDFRILTINVDYPDFPPIPEQQAAAVSLRQRYPGRVAFAATFSVENFNAPGWATSALKADRDCPGCTGPSAVKIWKNIGMALQNDDGSYVMPDDPRLEPVIAALERDHIVLLGHQAEPLNCWLPFEKMTVRSDRDYFREHPQYYMYEHPEMPSHDAILSARDRMLSRAPGAGVRRRTPGLAGMGRGQGGGVPGSLPQCPASIWPRAWCTCEYQAAT